MNLVALIILARLLTPSDFGLVAIAGIVVNFIGQFGDFGLASAIVRTRRDVDRAVEVAATLRLVLAGLLLPVTIVLAPYFAAALGAPQAADAIRLSSLLWLIAGAGFVSQTILWRSLDFRRQAAIGLAISLIGAFAAVLLAISGAGYWSLVLGNLTGALAGLALYWYVKPWKLHLTFDRNIARELFRYGKHVFAMGFIAFVIGSLDDAAVSILLGVAIVGYYQIAYKWSSVSSSMIIRTVGRVLFPTYASIQRDEKRLVRGMVESVRGISLLSFPVQVGIVLVAPEFVAVVLGAQWLPAVIPLQILAWSGLLMVTVQPVGDYFLAIGKSNVMSKTSMLNLTVLGVLVFPLGLVAGVSGVADAVLISSGAYALSMLWFLRRDIDSRISRLTKIFRVPLAGVAAMVLPILFLKSMPLETPQLLALEVASAAAAYAVVAFMMDADYIRRLASPIISSFRLMKSVGQERLPP